MLCPLTELALSLPSPESFKTIRLSTDRRDALIAHAKKTLCTPQEEDDERAAHAAVLAAVNVLAIAYVSRTDLDVLRRYGHVDHVGHVLVHEMPVFSASEEGVTTTDRTATVVFCFCPRDVRRPPNNSRTGCHRRTYETVPDDQTIEVPSRWAGHESAYDSDGNYINGKALDTKNLPSDAVGDLKAAVTAWLAAKAHTDAAREAVLRPLRSVVYGKPTLQAVAEVWPEAMRLADRFEGVRLADEAGAALIGRASFGPAGT